MIESILRRQAYPVANPICIADVHERFDSSFEQRCEVVFSLEGPDIRDEARVELHVEPAVVAVVPVDA